MTTAPMFAGRMFQRRNRNRNRRQRHRIDRRNERAVISTARFRRNLHPDQASYLRGKRYNGEKEVKGGDRSANRGRKIR